MRKIQTGDTDGQDTTEPPIQPIYPPQLSLQMMFWF